MMCTRNPPGWVQETAEPGTRQLLAESVILKGMPPDFVAEVGQHCRLVNLREDDVLISAGDPVDKAYFLLSGELKLSVYTRTGKVVSLGSVHPGAFLGDAALAGNRQAPYSAEAAKPSVLASLNARACMELARKEARFLRALFEQLFCRQILLTEQIVELSTLSMQARLHKEILRMCRDAMQRDGSSTIHPMPTHSELARRIGTQREAVSRQMSHLQQQGLIMRREGGGVYVPSVSRLVELQTMPGE